MKKRYFVIITAILIFVLAGVGVFKLSRSSVANESGNDVAELTTIRSADDILRNPSKFTGYVAVAGKVAMVDESNSMFGLGCSDGCLILPVKYSGEIPEKNSDVTVYGEVKKVDGKGYIFEGEKVTVK